MQNSSINFKSGYVALIGMPNVGKSTLLNQILEYKLSIVSNKPQTTRTKILGILTKKDFQIVFIDTPGLLEPSYSLQTLFMKHVKTAIKDSDVIIYIHDVTKGDLTEDEIAKYFSYIKKPIVFVINKIDLISKKLLLPLISKYHGLANFSSIIPISALKRDGLENLVNEIRNLLPYSPPFFPPDELSSQQERFFVSEIIREKIYHFFGDEIPYSTHVQIETFKEKSTGKNFISAVIYVEKNSHKGIIIGKGGQALKRIGQISRKEIEKLLGKQIYLELNVKILKNWRRNSSELKRLGYS